MASGAPSNGISGVAVAITLGGVLLAYSGLKGKGFAATVQALLAGKDPATVAQANAITTDKDGSTVSGQSAGSQPITGEASNANAQIIAQYLTAKGLSPGAVAGALGNLQVESGFNPAASNSAEGAIGIVQWEGGRRTRLQQYAASRGTTETDLNTQLDFMWNELNTSYPTALNALRLTSDPTQAATIWDSQYEISAGTSRQARISAAKSFFTSLWGNQ